jgi:hypothetical protein|tara:strand:+ start:891 stop:1289 length:399 start_codon:yes stop_codon:yes gene_type:complete
MQTYKGWSGDFRKESLKLTNKAKRLGWIASPTCCNRCGQTKGILHLHNEDYDVTYYTLKKVFDRFPVTITKEEKDKVNSVLEEICWRCHMLHHSVRRNKQAVEKYFAEIKNGKQYPPVYKHDFTILKRDHNV